jgi:uncharacterized protein (DUF1778 family)
MAANVRKNHTNKIRVDETIIAEHDKTIFSSEDWHMFFAMIDNPSEPTERMKKAAQKYREIISSQ